MFRLSSTWLASLTFTLVVDRAVGARTAAQIDPLILHSAVECWPQTEFVVLRAVFQPGVEIATAKAYFRSNMYADFYYVDLAVQPSGQGEAILPKPSPETTSVVYYLEAVTRTYNSARSPEWSATVADPDTCKRRYPGLAWFEGDSPNIVLGATRVGAAAIPPGFQAQGITGFVNASGVAGAASGGGFGTGAAIGVIGGAAAGLGVLGATAGGSNSTTTTVAQAPPATSTTTAPTTTTAPGSAPLSCFTTQPSPAVIFENQSIRFDASCSRGDALVADAVVNYYWDFGNGKIVEGPDRRVVNTLYTTPGIYTTLLIVQDEAGNRSSTSSGVTVRATPPPTTSISITADLSVTKAAPPSIFLGDNLDYTVTVMNGGPLTGTNVVLTDTLPASVNVRTIQPSQGTCTQSGFVVTCNLGTLPTGGRVVVTIGTTPTQLGLITNVATVSAAEGDGDLSNNRAQVQTNVAILPLRADFSGSVGAHFPPSDGAPPPSPLGSGLPPPGSAEGSPLETSFTSELEGAAEARLRMNDAAFEAVHVSKPDRVRLVGRGGVNVIEAEVLAETDGTLRFDFSGAARFVAGSIEVEVGDVTSLTATSVVFGLREGAPARARFRFKLAP